MILKSLLHLISGREQMGRSFRKLQNLALGKFRRNLKLPHRSLPTSCCKEWKGEVWEVPQTTIFSGPTTWQTTSNFWRRSAILSRFKPIRRERARRRQPNCWRNFRRSFRRSKVLFSKPYWLKYVPSKDIIWATKAYGDLKTNLDEGLLLNVTF